jgi:hypothetical protein
LSEEVKRHRQAGAPFFILLARILVIPRYFYGGKEVSPKRRRSDEAWNDYGFGIAPADSQADAAAFSVFCGSAQAGSALGLPEVVGERLRKSKVWRATGVVDRVRWLLTMYGSLKEENDRMSAELAKIYDAEHEELLNGSR